MIGLRGSRTCIAIDLKSFYASVECLERGLDPLDANLVVADESRTDGTICLAVTPSLKARGVPGRGRLFEVRRKAEEVNAERLRAAPEHRFTGSSVSDAELKASPRLALDFIIAPPRMAAYMEYSARVHEIYMKHVAPEDMIVYSVDEVFMDVTDYLDSRGLSPRGFAAQILRDVRDATGLTAAAGVGTNLYLCKIAMDILAKRMPADENGVRIAELDEAGYRRILWTHRPITDFWRVGKGCARKLEENGMFTMGDIARQSVRDEDLLYRLFGKNAELLIDHAWGWEPCSVPDVRAYRPASNSLSSGQVLKRPYTAEKAGLVIREMADLLALDLVDRGLVTDQLVITVGYDVRNLADPVRRGDCRGAFETDAYGRRIPKHSRGTANLGSHTSSSRRILAAAAGLYDRIVNPDLLIRRLNITANRVMEESAAPKPGGRFEQLNLFTDRDALEAAGAREKTELERERRIQKTLIAIKRKYGKNAILKGMNLEEGATGRERNGQIGGHRA